MAINYTNIVNSLKSKFALKSWVTSQLSGKQDKLTASTNIQISSDNKISATDTKYTAGDNVQINGTVISATDTVYTLPVATDTTLGGVKEGENITIADDGTISAEDSYVLPTASDSVKGGVKIGNNLSMSGEVLSAVDTTYNDATQSVHGLLSTDDKTKLDGLENYDDTEVKADIEAIEGKIPSQATSSNQLADKSFVNSSISTATATFRGTYNTLAELEAVTTKDINDYGFVKATDSSGNSLYKRYKYDGSAWVWEYDLNNSSFTSAQWATINSGLTSTSLDSYYDKDDTDDLLDDKVDKVTGKGLSTNDYDATAKAKVDAITVANLELITNKVTSIDTSITTEDNKYPTQKAVKDSLQNAFDDLATAIDNIS